MAISSKAVHNSQRSATPMRRVALLSLFVQLAAGRICDHWCDTSTCFKERCADCEVCIGVNAQAHCSPWCNVYVCSAPGGYCLGCDVCASLWLSTHCERWCNYFTCFVGNFCDGCSSCGGQAKTSSPWAIPFSTKAAPLPYLLPGETASRSVRQEYTFPETLEHFADKLDYFKHQVARATAIPVDKLTLSGPVAQKLRDFPTKVSVIAASDSDAQSATYAIVLAKLGHRPWAEPDGLGVHFIRASMPILEHLEVVSPFKPPLPLTETFPNPSKVIAQNPAVIALAGPTMALLTFGT